MSAAGITVTVVYAPAQRQVRTVTLSMTSGGSVQAAIAASGLAAEFPGMATGIGHVGVWGRKVALTQPLRDGDRVEIWRELRVDPKLARRERFGQQGAKAAGLFAKRRPGAKPGY